MYVDNILYFRHVKYPNIILQTPPVKILFKNKLLNKIYVYGCYVVPNIDELKKQIMVKRIYDNEAELGMDALNYDEKDYTIEIIYND